MMLDVGALTTITPAVVAVLMSTLSRPTPARATTFSTGAAAIASASIWVAERTSTAFASARPASSAVRSVPSIWRTSKSGPRASIVAGESSSAMSTTGFGTTADPLERGRAGRGRKDEWMLRRTPSGRIQVTLYRLAPRRPIRVTAGRKRSVQQRRRIECGVRDDVEPENRGQREPGEHHEDEVMRRSSEADDECGGE